MANTQETAISNVDRSNLNHTYSKVKELNESGNYTESIKVAEIGLLIALKKKNKIWVNKFDKIIAQMREISNKKKTAKNSASLEKFIYKSEHQNGSAEFSINLEEDLTKIKGLGTTAKSRLNNVGINSIKQLANLNPAELAKVKGFSQSLATNIISRAKSYLNNPESDEPRKNHTEKEAIYEKEVLKPPDKEIKEIEKPIIELNQKDENYMEILKSTTSIEKSKDKKNGANWILKDNANDRIEENIGESTELKDHGFNKNDIINDFLSDLNNDDIDFKIQKNSITDTINIEQNEFFNEWLHENDLKEMKTNIQHYLKLKNYQLIVRNSNSLFKILNNIDLLAFKILNVNNYTNLVLILPIKVLNSKGTLIISENFIDYQPINQKVIVNNSNRDYFINITEEDLKSVQKIIYQNIISKGILFQLLEKHTNNKIFIEKSKDNKPLFIRYNNLEYKIIVDPILTCLNEPASFEKTTKFTYQKNTNLHIIDIKNLSDLIEFLEKKYYLIENYSEQKNSIQNYVSNLYKFNENIRKYSIPFVLFGGLFLILILFQINFLINTFTSLGLAGICVYTLIILYMYLKEIRLKRDIIENFSKPYYLRDLQMNEADLIIISDKFTPLLMEQFIYECFEKDADLSIISNIEEEKTKDQFSNLNLSKNDSKINIKNKTTPNFNLVYASGSASNKYSSNYSSFLED